MKKTLRNLLALSILFSSVPVFAETDISIPAEPFLSRVSSVTEREEQMSSFRISKLQARGDILIKQRIKSLESNSEVILKDKTLTTEQKTALTAILSKNSNELTALRASLATSTNATSTRMLFSSIFTTFRIYGVVIPQVRIEKRIYDLQNHSLKLSGTFLTIQKKIDEAKAKGSDVVAWQKSLDDAKILVANDMNILATTMTMVSALKPSDYGTTSTRIIESANANLKSVHTDFSSLKKNIHKNGRMSNIQHKDKEDNKKDREDKKDKKDDNDRDDAVVLPLSGTVWTWTSSLVNGTTSLSPVGGTFVLSFGKDNRIFSTTDCNAISGMYTTGTTSQLTFSTFMSTKMFCEGSKEIEYTKALSTTKTYSVQGRTLTLVNASGTMTFLKK